MKMLKELRKKRGWNQSDVAKSLNISTPSYSRYETGKFEPSNDLLVEIAKLYGVTTDYLLGNSDNKKEPVKGYRRIPVYGTVAAGIPNEAIQNPDPDEWEDIPESMAHGREFFALRIHGESMTPVLLDGDVVIVERIEDCENGDIAIVLVNGDEATCKQVKKQMSGVTLIGYNAAVYPPHFYTNEEVTKLPVRIIGVVKEMRRKIK